MPGPHDRFVRRVFGEPSRAAAELKAALPARLASQVQWDTLRREPTGTVDSRLRESESDLLFSARLVSGKRLLFYVLLEHQSRVDPWMAFRLLRYVVRQWEQWREKHPRKKLPVILPLVLYHGKKGRWTAPLRLEALLDLPDEEPVRRELNKAAPRFRYMLDDLTAQQVAALKARAGPALAQMAWRALRFGMTRGLARELREWEGLFGRLWEESAEGEEDLRLLVHYLLQVGDEEARKVLGEVLDSALGTQQMEEAMQTVGQRLIAKGRKEGEARGLAKGEAKGLAKGLLSILAERKLAVSPKERQRILSCTDTALLEQWLKRALTASDLSQVLREPGETRRGAHPRRPEKSQPRA